MMAGKKDDGWIMSFVKGIALELVFAVIFFGGIFLVFHFNLFG